MYNDKNMISFNSNVTECYGCW